MPTFKLALINAAFGDRKSVSKYLAPIHAIAPGDSTQVEMWRADAYAYAGQADSTFKYADKLAARASNNPVAGRVAHFVPRPALPDDAAVRQSARGIPAERLDVGRSSGWQRRLRDAGGPPCGGTAVARRRAQPSRRQSL